MSEYSDGESTRMSEYDPKQFWADRSYVLQKVTNDGLKLRNASEDLRDDTHVALAALKSDKRCYRYIAKDKRNDKEFVRMAVASDGAVLEYVEVEYRSDWDIVASAVSNDGLALKFASDDLRNDPSICKTAVTTTGLALKLVPQTLQNDIEIVLEAVTNDGKALEFASKDLKANRDIVLIALKSYGMALKFAHKKFGMDREVVLAAVNSSAGALKYASKKFQADRELVLSAVTSDGMVLKYASKELQKDPEIVQAAVESDNRAIQFSSREILGDKKQGKRYEKLKDPAPSTKRPSTASFAKGKDASSLHSFGEDHLKMTHQANAIADLLASKDLATPFVAGVLGDWGSGKTFFMNLIEKRLGKVLDQNLNEYMLEHNGNIDKYPYCGHIYTVYFSAWAHASKGNDLWSSLMHRIYFDLNEQLDIESEIRKLDPKLSETGINYVELKRALNAKEAFLEYLSRKTDKSPSQFWFDYHSQGDRKVTQALVNIMNEGHGDEATNLSEKVKELEDLKARIKRRLFWSSLHQRTEEHFRDELKTFQEYHPGDESVHNLLKNVPMLTLWTKLFLGGINQSPFLGWAILFLLIVSIVVIIVGACVPSMQEQVGGFVAGVLIPFVLATLVMAYTMAKAEKAFVELGVSTALVLADAAFEKRQRHHDVEEQVSNGFITSLTDMGGSHRTNGLDEIRRLEHEISAIKKRRWLVEGGSLHDQVTSRLNTSSQTASLGATNRAKEDIEMLSYTMEQTFENQERRKDPQHTEARRISQGESLTPSNSNASEHSRSIQNEFEVHGCLGVTSSFISKMCSALLHFFKSWTAPLFRSCKKFFVGDSEKRPKSESIIETNPFPRGRPRVALFIDDLDRCSPKMALEVIEALQLLMDSTENFVAVVALDVRFITRALEYSEILIKESSQSGIQYLQKVIQLPFSVPRMSSEKMDNFFKKQLSYNADADSDSRSSVNSKKKKKKKKSKKLNGYDDTVDTPSMRSLRWSDRNFSSKGVDVPSVENYCLSDDSLTFSRRDIAMIAKAGEAANVNPRTGKLLANIFKVLKLIWERSYLPTPEEEVQEAVLLLIAMSTSYPLLVAQILAKLDRTLKQPSKHESLDSFVKKAFQSYSALRHFRGLMELRWGSVEIRKIGLANIQLIQSFSFVGDSRVEVDILTAPPSPNSPRSKRISASSGSSKRISGSSWTNRSRSDSEKPLSASSIEQPPLAQSRRQGRRSSSAGEIPDLGRQVSRRRHRNTKHKKQKSKKNVINPPVPSALPQRGDAIKVETVNLDGTVESIIRPNSPNNSRSTRTTTINTDGSVVVSGGKQKRSNPKSPTGPRRYATMEMAQKFSSQKHGIEW